jgi:hypothetical protein
MSINNSVVLNVAMDESQNHSFSAEQMLRVYALQDADQFVILHDVTFPSLVYWWLCANDPHYCLFLSKTNRPPLYLSVCSHPADTSLQ